MDRSDPPLYAAADPPTVKTEPPGPTPDAGCKSDRSAGGAAEAGAGPELSPERDADTDAAGVEADAAVQPDLVSPEPQPQLSHDNVASTAVAEAPPDVAQALPLADAPPTPSSTKTLRHRPPLLENWDRERVKSVGVRAAKVAAIVFSAWFTVVLFLIVVYRFVNPPFSSLMVMQWLTGTSIHRQWVPVEEISPNLVRAVIASEDGRFCSHWGIDFAEVAAAIKRSSGGVPRGASTITMQVAKNLFLWPAKSYVRKVIEVPLTYAIELMWPKRRIMEVYLNIAEWGPGVFGAEAASQEHFSRSAARLSARQAAQLAVVLPNPFVRDAGDPGPWTAHRASIIQRRAARSPEEATCVLSGD